MKISLCMIVKNEEDYIKQCLDNALKIVDEAIVVDTGSTDKTIDIIENKFKNKVKLVKYKWENDFSKARNESLKYATGDWILVLDADEKIVASKEKLIEFLERAKSLKYTLPIYNMFDSGAVKCTNAMVRLFKNENPHFERAIHEQVVVGEANQYPDSIEENLVKIFHYGYLNGTKIKKNKKKRNKEIIQREIKKNKNDPFNWYNLGNEKMEEGKYSEAIKHFIKSHELCNGVRKMYHDELMICITKCMIILKRYEQCRLFLDIAIEDDRLKNNPDMHYYNGIIYENMKKYEDAIKSYEKAINIGSYSGVSSTFGMATFLPLLQIARIYVKTNNISAGIYKYMECIFHKDNVKKQGLEELVNILKKNNLNEILEELEVLLKNHKVSSKSQLPYITVVIATYNQKAYLQQAIKSILNQDYPNIKILIGDDCSTDGTKEVMELYEQYENIKYVRNKENMGGNKNCTNLLYNHIDTEYVLFIGHDDYLIKNNYISKAMDVLINNKNVSLVWANVRLYDEVKGFYKDTEYKLPKIISGRDYFLNYECGDYKHITGVLTSVFRKSNVLKLGFGKEKTESQDLFLYLKAMLTGDIAFIEDVAAVYRIHENNISNNMPKELDISTIEELEKLKELGAKSGFSEEKLNTWINNRVYGYIAWRVDSLYKNNDREYAKELLNEVNKKYQEVVEVIKTKLGE